MKGDVASFLDDDALFLCFAGVTAVKHLEDTLRQMEQIQEVVITLDMDKLMNWRVQNALTKIIALVRSIRGIKIRVMNWNIGDFPAAKLQTDLEVYKERLGRSIYMPLKDFGIKPCLSKLFLDQEDVMRTEIKLMLLLVILGDSCLERPDRAI